MSAHERRRAWQLQRAAARHVLGLGGTSELARAADAITDWPHAVSVSRDHGMLGLVARALRETRAPGALETAAAHRADTGRTLAQLALLRRIAAALEASDIRSLSYKGPLLGRVLYGDDALRLSTDLDVVVARRDYDRARDVLATLGLPPRGGHSRAQERALFAWLGQASFGTGTDDFVELHWRLAPAQFPFALAPEQAIARAALLDVAGHRVRVLADADLAVTLAMHGARHLYERVEWLLGVAVLLGRVGAVPLMAHATALRARRMTVASAVAVQRVLGVRLGAEWEAIIAAEPAAARAGERIAATVLAQGEDGAAQPAGAELQRLFAILVDAPHHRVACVLHAALLPTEREWELLRLPDALLPLYRVIRPARLAAIYAARVAAHAARRLSAR